LISAAFAVMVLSYVAAALQWDEFDHVIEDGENDLIEFSIAEFKVYRERGKEHIDISKITSYIHNDTVNIEFMVHGSIVDSDLVEYEVMLTLFETSHRYGDYDLILSYSQKTAVGWFPGNGTEIDLTNSTTVRDDTIIFRIMRSFFFEADIFEMEGRSVETIIEDLDFFMDSTDPIEKGAEEKPSKYYVYYILSVIALVIITIVLLLTDWKKVIPYRRRGSNLCCRCKGLIRDGDEFCYHCGEVIHQTTER